MHKITYLNKALDKISMRVRHSTTLSQEQTIGANFVINELMREFKLERCHICNRYFRHLGGHIVGHYNFKTEIVESNP